MIGYLEGTIIASDERSVIIKSGGVGWRVFSGPQTRREWQDAAGAVKAFTHLYVREGVQELFGFRSHGELRFFELLIGVTGVGPRLSQLILDTLSLDVTVSAVQSKKDEVLSRVPGVGSRIAQRIIIDIEPKLVVHGFASDADLSSLEKYDEALEALMSLGYKRGEAQRALRKVPEKVTDAARQVEQALKLLGKT